MVDLLRWLGPLTLAAGAAALIDLMAVRRGLTPPGFRVLWRRLGAGTLLTLLLFVTVFQSLGQIGLPTLEIDLSSVHYSQLFLVHTMLIIAIVGWLLFGFAGFQGEQSLVSVSAAQLGMRCRSFLKEVGLGLGLGFLIWPLLLLVVGSVAAALFFFGGEELLPQQPPEMIVWIAGLPLALKLAVALSAGVVEELFFRGFLQPRIGILLSTVLFAGAHLAYDEPFMLVGITCLSLAFAGLVRWRQNIWAAATAHFLFDAVQLLIVIPWALGEWDQVHNMASEIAVLLTFGAPLG
ncbi:MAG: CPBP family intramembrane metalloprotease [Thermoanaerobaculia bacterium]|nr:CPBP family intramembrane metalloprotease [Thermoanaerobaculia bacterium]